LRVDSTAKKEKICIEWMENKEKNAIVKTIDIKRK